MTNQNLQLGKCWKLCRGTFSLSEVAVLSRTFRYPFPIFIFVKHAYSIIWPSLTLTSLVSIKFVFVFICIYFFPPNPS